MLNFFKRIAIKFRYLFYPLALTSLTAIVLLALKLIWQLELFAQPVNELVYLIIFCWSGLLAIIIASFKELPEANENKSGLFKRTKVFFIRCGYYMLAGIFSALTIAIIALSIRSFSLIT